MGKLATWFVALMVAMAVLGHGRPPASASAADPARPFEAAGSGAPSPAADRSAPAGNGIADTVLTRAPDGHFYADGQVNGQPVHFLIDTGSTSVALTRADAQAAGVQFAQGDFTETGSAAGGSIALKPIILDRVALGPLSADHVDGVVVDGDLGVSLLGQSWLARVGRVEIEGDRMTLR